MKIVLVKVGSNLSYLRIIKQNRTAVLFCLMIIFIKFGHGQFDGRFKFELAKNKLILKDTLGAISNFDSSIYYNFKPCFSDFNEFINLAVLVKDSSLMYKYIHEFVINSSERALSKLNNETLSQFIYSHTILHNIYLNNVVKNNTEIRKNILMFLSVDQFIRIYEFKSSTVEEITLKINFEFLDLLEFCINNKIILFDLEPEIFILLFHSAREKNHGKEFLVLIYKVLKHNYISSRNYALIHDEWCLFHNQSPQFAEENTISKFPLTSSNRTKINENRIVIGLTPIL
ncbi:MAG: hypothetical protein IPK88_18310 [Saprospiraceae bacterium]|nr:hypothetical protein [Candidatus Defluviibacterium haderslevense]